MRPLKPRLTPEEIRDRALECRAARMYIAKNPGRTALQIKKGANLNSVSCLFKMLGMGIVRFEQQLEQDGKRPQRWFVVPQ